VALGETYDKICGVRYAATLAQIVRLYTLWTTVTVPEHFHNTRGKDLRWEPDSSHSEGGSESGEGNDRVISWMSKSTKAMSNNGGWEKLNSGEDVAGYTQESPRRLTAMSLDIEGLPEYVYSPRLYKRVLAGIDDERRYKETEAREIEAMETGARETGATEADTS
jgi:hypothetical protein